MAVQFQPPSFLVREKFEKLNFGYESQTSVDSMSSCPSTPTTPTSPIEYEIQICTAEDKEPVLDFLRTFFFKDEPMNSSLELITEDQPRCLALEEYSAKDIDNGVNLKAVHNGKLVGVCINDIVERGWLDNAEPVDTKHDKFSKILKLLDHVARDSDPFKTFTDCDKAMYVKIVSVDGAFRGQGIAKELMAKTRELAKQNGCGFMSVDCSSHFTACALKKLGFKLHYSLNYADYKVNGEVVLTPAAPHRAVTVYTQRVN